jgi:hypothetical protein
MNEYIRRLQKKEIAAQSQIIPAISSAPTAKHGHQYANGSPGDARTAQ